MVAKAIPKPSKTASKKQSKTNTKTGNKSKKPAAPMSMIATPDALLAIPVGDIPATLPRMNLGEAFDYDVDMHTAKKGKFKGVEMPQLQITDADGKAHNIYPQLGVALGEAILKNPIVVYWCVAYALDQRERVKA